MTYYTLEDAQDKLQNLIEEARKGNRVIIKPDDGIEVELVVTQTQHKLRTPGSAKGLIVIYDDFDDPLDDFAEYME